MDAFPTNQLVAGYPSAMDSRKKSLLPMLLNLFISEASTDLLNSAMAQKEMPANRTAFLSWNGWFSGGELDVLEEWSMIVNHGLLTVKLIISC